MPIETTSRLNAPAAAVWERVASFAGVNDELRPFLRMTAPGGSDRIEPSEVVLGERLGRSYMLLFAVLPVDYDDVTLVALEPGRGFHERSSMLSMRTWEHIRTVEPDGPGACTVTDRVSFAPRLGLPAALFAPLVGRVFEHRHRRLRMRFGGVAANRDADARP
ncbi:MAG TPA: SRPBCC family protein [Thermoleophilaceae bacterium]|nr:SRPBCC family protein [Thermoleophilaceae bacterium]